MIHHTPWCILFPILLLHLQSRAHDSPVLSADSSTGVEVASVQPAPVRDAPGYISTFSADEIRSLGAATLADLAQFAPGQYVQYQSGVGFLQSDGLMFYGNSSHLVTIDGVPVNNPRNFWAPLQNDLPLFFFDQVEWMAGPAGAIQPRAASCGVINVRSSGLKSDGYALRANLEAGAESSALPGRMASSGLALVYKNRDSVLVTPIRTQVGALLRKEMHEISLGYSYYHNPGALENFARYDNSVAGPYRDNEQCHFAQARYRLARGIFEGVQAGVFFTHRTDGYGSGWLGDSADRGNSHTFDAVIPFVQYKRTFDDRVWVNAFLRVSRGRESFSQYNREGWWAPGGERGGLQVDVPAQDLINDVRVGWQINPYVSLTGGGTFFTQNISRGTISSGVPDSMQTNDLLSQHESGLSLFSGLQGTIPLLEGLDLATVVSYNGVTAMDVPYAMPAVRAHATFRPWRSLAIKYAFSSGFRMPTAEMIISNQDKEEYIRSLHTSLPPGVPNLTPERFRRHDIALAWWSRVLQIQLSRYFLINYNLFLRDYVRVESSQNVELWQSNPEKAVGSGGYRFELTARPFEGLWIRGHAAFTVARRVDTSVDTLSITPVDEVPLFKAGIAAAYSAPFGLSAGFSVTAYTSFSRDSAYYHPGFAVRSNPTTYQGYVLGSVNVCQRIRPWLEVGMRADNVGNTIYYSDRSATPMPNRVISLFGRFDIRNEL